jgi:ABC-type Fe3+-hydroxamate transport system substrate-binding protein
MRKIIFISLLVGLSILLAACGSTAAPATATKQVNIKVETTPSPAAKGDVEIVLTITDANGNPIEGAKISVSADHPDMVGMGMSGSATGQGGGKYSIKANFSDSGAWKLTVYVRNGELDYQEKFEFPVQ